MKALLWVVAGLGVAAVAVFFAMRLFTGIPLQPLAEKVLEDCRDGKQEAVYEAAAPEFRAETPLARFREYLAVRTRALGAYRRVVRQTGASLRSSSSAGTSGSVGLDLEYERGTAHGELGFVKRDGAWLLLSVKITFDETRLPVADRAVLEGLSRELMDLYDRSAFVALYQRLSEELRETWPADTYESQVKDVRRKAGRVLEATLRETREEESGKVRLKFALRYENGPGDAAFAWAWGDARWHLLGFDMHFGAR